MRCTLTILVGVLLTGAVRAEQPAPAKATAEGVEYFEKHIRPLFAEHCVSCHGPKKQMGGLRLDTRTGFLQGGDNGAIVSTKDPARSRLLELVRHQGDIKMPPKKKLSDAAIEQLTTWVRLGAPFPDDAGQPSTPKTVADWRSSHWAFRPVAHPTPPVIPNPKAVIRNPIDAFVQAKLAAKGLEASPEADRRTLLRRLTFDLTGLPPTAAEIDAFVADTRPDAYERVVERLLASPAYGERWGRHWLDVARYADTKGYVFQEERRYPYAYTYRDYVVEAFNSDRPYDRFILEQLAADQLDLGDDPSSLAAMGFLTLGRRFLNNTHDIIDDRIDVVTRGLQGLTVACARCHDHKFDPIPQKDYYSLYGVFAASVEPKDLPLLETPEETAEVKAFQAELAKRQQAADEFRAKNKTGLDAKNRELRNRLQALQKKVEEWKASSKSAPPRGMVLNDVPRPGDAQLFVRGNPNNRGPRVPRQFLEVLTPDRKPFTRGSGRLELARAIASTDNPLTARVMVNRVWMHHFGQGLVRTPGDFGSRGEPPTHPELLDWLAWRFVADGWSVKALHRLIVQSATYRQASASRPEGAALDPENQFLWRQNRRRLELEALRDSLLTVSGRLDRTMGGPAVDITRVPSPPRRTVYAFIERQNLPGVFRTFDFASPDTSTQQRYTTTVPQQALFLLNSPFAVEQAKAFVARAEVAGVTDPAARVQAMYRLAFGRDADADEVRLGVGFVQAVGGKIEKGLTAWQQYAQVLLLANEFAFVD